MKHLVIACDIMKHELLLHQHGGISFVFLEQCLHNTPQKMRGVIQDEINEAGRRERNTIILGYGLCGNGVLGVKSDRQRLAIPRIHDCITLFLGSREKYTEEHGKEPGTYYLTKGWIEKEDTPLGNYKKYCQRYGTDEAEWVIREEFKAYKRIAFVHTGVQVSAVHREHALENARFLDLKYEEIKGSPAFFEKMLREPWDEDFIILEPGEALTQELFLDYRKETDK